jgi:hypothetical protein
MTIATATPETSLEVSEGAFRGQRVDPEVAGDLLEELRTRPCDAPKIRSGPPALAPSAGRQNAFESLRPACGACGHSLDDHLSPEDVNTAPATTGPSGPEGARAIPGHCDVDGCACEGGPAALPKP